MARDLVPGRVLYTPLAIDGYDASMTIGRTAEFGRLSGHPFDLGPVIINFSFGVRRRHFPIRCGVSTRETVLYRRYVLAQAGTDDADKKIVVWAAGNAGY